MKDLLAKKVRKFDRFIIDEIEELDFCKEKNKQKEDIKYVSDQNDDPTFQVESSSIFRANSMDGLEEINYLFPNGVTKEIAKFITHDFYHAGFFSTIRSSKTEIIS